MSGYSNYSLHQKYTSVQGQILTLNQQVSNNTSPTLASVLTNSNDAGNQSIQNVANIDSDTIDTQTLRIIGTSSNTSQISVNATGDLVIDDDQDVIVDIGNKFTVQNKANSNISLDVDIANEKVAIGGAVDSANTHKLQVQGNIETSGVTLTNNLNSSSLTVTGAGHAKFTAKNGDLLLDSLTGGVVVDDVDFVVRDNIGGEKIRVDVTNDRVTTTDLTASSITTSGTASTGALTSSSITTSGALSAGTSTLGSTSASDLTIGSGQVFNSSGDLTAPSITSTGALTAGSISTTGTASTGALTSTSLKNTNNTFSVDATGILSAATINAGGYQNTNATFSVSAGGALTASSLTSSGSLSFSPVSVADKINLYESTYSIGIAGGTSFISSVRNIDFVYRANSSDTSTTAKLRFKIDQTNPQIHSSISDGHIEFFRNANVTPAKYLTLSSNSNNDTVLNSVGMFALRASNVNTDHVTLTSSALSINTTTDFVVANGVTEYFKVDKTANKVDMTDTDVNGALVVTGTANTGALTASSITTSGTASTGALTASSISTSGTANTGALTASSITTSGTASTGALTASSLTSSGLLSFSPVSVADKILLYDSTYSMGVSNGTVFISSAGNVDFVRRVSSSDTSTTPKLRFNLTATNPQLISSSGGIEFCEFSSTTPFLTLNSSGFAFNETIYTSEGLHAFRCDSNATNRMIISNTGVIIPSGNTLTVQTPTANAHASTKLYVDETFTRVGGTYQQVINAPSTFNTSVTITPPTNCYKMDAIVYGKGGSAGGNLIQGSVIYYGGSGGGGSGSSTSSVPVNTSTSFTFSYANVLGGGTSGPGGILRISSTVLTNYTIVAGVNGGNGGISSGGGVGGSGGVGASQWNQTSHFPFYTFGAGTSGFSGGSQAYPIAFPDPSSLPPGVGVPSVAGGNEGDYGAGQRFSGVAGFAPSDHFDSPVCIITWYLKPS